jgi:hypothetical protein
MLDISVAVQSPAPLRRGPLQKPTNPGTDAHPMRSPLHVHAAGDRARERRVVGVMVAKGVGNGDSPDPRFPVADCGHPACPSSWNQPGERSQADRKVLAGHGGGAGQDSFGVVSLQPRQLEGDWIRLRLGPGNLTAHLSKNAVLSTHASLKPA